jgi:hypothetical protein
MIVVANSKKLPHNLPGETEEKHKNLSQGSQSPV